MSDIVFVRHGQSEFNAGNTDKFDSELTAKGIEQAKRAALFLKDEIKIRELFVGYVSPYLRCLQTASLLMHSTGIRFIVDPRIGESPESIHIKKAQVPNREVLFPDFDWNGYKKWFDYSGDTEQKYKSRIEGFLGKILSKALVCSHMKPIKDMIIFTCSPKEDFVISNCSVSRIRYGRPAYIGKEI